MGGPRSRALRLASLFGAALWACACAEGDLDNIELDAQVAPQVGQVGAPPKPLPSGCEADGYCGAECPVDPDCEGPPPGDDPPPNDPPPNDPPPNDPPPNDPPPIDPCAGIGEGTSCLGDTLLICSDRGAHEVDCASQGWMCLVVQGQAACREDVPDEPPPNNPPNDPPPNNPPPADQCDNIDAFGRCVGDTLEFCDQGVERSVNCLAENARCAFVDNNRGFDCVPNGGNPPNNPPGGGDDLGAIIEACSGEDPAVVAISAVILCAIADDTQACIFACIAAALGG